MINCPARLTIVLVALLLVLGPAMGQVQLETWFSRVERYEASGEIQQDARSLLLGLFSANANGGYRSLEVTGSLTIEVDSRIDDPSVPVRVESNDTTTTVYHGPGHLRTSAVQAKHSLFLHAAEADIQFTDDRAWRARFTGSGSVAKPETPAQNREIPEVPVSGSFEVKETTADLRIEGAFWFSFFEWDMVLDTPDGSSIIHTGNDYEGLGGIDGDPIPPVGGRSEWREAFVTVHEGILVMPLDEADVEFMHAWLTSAEINGTLDVVGRQGSQGEIQTHTFTGHLITETGHPPNGAQMIVREPPPRDEPDLDPSQRVAAPAEGSDASPASAVQEISPRAAGIQALAGALVLGIAVAVNAWRRHRMGVRIQDAEAAYAEGRHARVLDLTPGLLRRKRTQRRATMMHALALLEEEGPHATRLFLEWLPPPRRPDDAMDAFLHACIAEREGDAERAARCVDECLAADANWAGAVASRPGLTETLALWRLAANQAYV